MKFLLVSLAVIAAASAQQFHQEHQPIAILRQAQDISPDGAFNYQYETENGIRASEQGQPGAQTAEGQVNAVEGEFSYTAPDGTPITVRYRADENGFQPQGDHLPVAPAIPELIQRSLDYIRDHPQPEEKHTQQTHRRF